MPRRIHGVRFAITSTARSVRRIAARGPGVGVDARIASAESAPIPWRWTARSCPSARHPTQFDASAVLEARARADDQITHGSGDDDVAGVGLAEDPRGDVHGQSPDVGAQQFTLAGVDAGANLDTQRLGVIAKSLGGSEWPASGRQR